MEGEDGEEGAEPSAEVLKLSEIKDKMD